MGSSFLRYVSRHFAWFFIILTLSLFLTPFLFHLLTSHLAFTCSKLTIETLEERVKYVQS